MQQKPKKRKNTVSKKTKTVSYYSLTRGAYYGFTSTIPLLVIYQIMAFFLTKSILSQNRSVAESWILGLFSLLGVTGFVILGFLGAGLIVYFYFEKKKKNIPVIKLFYLLMLLEALVYSFFFSAVVMRILKVIPYANNILLSLSKAKLHSFMLYIGAGYFEELIFRVIIYGGLYTAVLYTAKKIKPEKELRVFKVFTMIIIGVISSFLFSLAHHLAGEPFSVYAFWYRAISGMIFVVLFELRGFGIAAYTHAFYDIWVG